MAGEKKKVRDLDAILSALVQRGEDSSALFKRHGELSQRRFTGEPLTSAEEVELEAVRCALDVSELLQLWEGQRLRAETAEGDRARLREALRVARKTLVLDGRSAACAAIDKVLEVTKT